MLGHIYIPKRNISNDYFLKNEFYGEDKERIPKENKQVIDKLVEITGIEKRCYAKEEFVTSDLAYLAAKDALESHSIDKETLDYIIVAHNFGDVRHGMTKIDQMPTLAARVKHKLHIENPGCVAYDIIFGCPGWLEGVIQADTYIKAGLAKRVLVIGADTLSRVSDPHDRDSMIFADGAGVSISESTTSEEPVGILSHVTRSDTLNEAYFLFMGESYNPGYENDDMFLKMDGKKVYLYAIQTVPKVVKESLEKANVDIADVKKVLIHQANEKLDRKILKNLFKIYGEKVSYDIMPMTISWLGNTSVATLPTLLDLLMKNKLNDHDIHSGDIIVLASVGAGMNINSVVYKMP